MVSLCRFSAHYKLPTKGPCIFVGGMISMRKLQIAMAVLTCFVLVEAGLAQSSNASVGGLVQDASQAYIPGVMITATNTQTGVTATTISNEAGAYNISGLLPGTYKL